MFLFSFVNLLCLSVLIQPAKSGISGTDDLVQATRSTLKEAAREGTYKTVGRRSDVQIRTSFFNALQDIEKSILIANVNYRRMSTSRLASSVASLRRLVVTAASNGNYKLGRELYGLTSVLESKRSLSQARRRHKRDATSFVTYLKKKLGEQTFNQFFNIESGTSLTFVIDITGSMVEDIDQVRVLVRNLSSPEENEDDPGSGFYNFLISTFSDPGYGPADIYEDKGNFLSAIEGIEVVGGGDCDEMVLSGLVVGLEWAEYYSPVFIFTDAGPKDDDVIDNVYSLADSLSAPIYFFITNSEDCEQNIESYKSIAETTNGQVFSLTKKEIGSLSSLVSSAGVGKSLLSSGSDKSTEIDKDRKRGTSTTYSIPFPVDDTVERLMVSISFSKNTGSSYLLDPDHQLQYPTFVSDKTNSRIYELDSPLHGEWILKAITDYGNDFTYKINSISPSNLDFGFYFLRQVGRRSMVTDYTVPGDHLKLVITVLSESANTIQDGFLVQLVDTSGNTLTTIRDVARSMNSANQYLCDVTVPSTVFKLKLKGTTVAGSNFVRMSQKTVTPSMVIIKPLSMNVGKRVAVPGSSGNIYLKLEHYTAEDEDFTITFTNTDVITTTSPIVIERLPPKRSKLVKLEYEIPRDTREGVEIRITLIASNSSGDLKGKHVYAMLVSKHA